MAIIGINLVLVVPIHVLKIIYKRDSILEVSTKCENNKERLKKKPERWKDKIDKKKKGYLEKEKKSLIRAVAKTPQEGCFLVDHFNSKHFSIILHQQIRLFNAKFLFIINNPRQHDCITWHFFI